MELLELSLKDIKPYANNPRKNDEAVQAVMESIQQCEYVAPIVVDENHVILAGHTRLKALKKLGFKSAQVIVKEGLTEEQKRKYRLLDNKTGELAEWDFDLLAEDIADLDFSGFDIEWGIVSPDDYGESFELPDGDKSEICQMTFTLHERQAELIKEAIKEVKDNITETFGNQNSNGNALYEVVRQWAEQRK